MSWGRIDDGLHAHEKAAQAGLEAMGLWALCLSWARWRRSAGGFTPRAVVLKHCGRSARKLAALTTRLVDSRLWEVAEGGWVFHDWADYQPDDESLSEKRASAGRLGAESTNKRKATEHKKTVPASDAATGRLTDPPPIPSPNPREEIPPVAPPGGEPERERPRDPFGDGCLGSAWVEELRLARGMPATRLAIGELRKLVAVVDAHGVDADGKPLPDRAAWLRPQARAFAQRDGGQLTLTVWAFADWMDNEKRSRPRPGAVPVQAAPPAGQRGWQRRGTHVKARLDAEEARPADDGSAAAGAGSPVRPVH